MIASSPATSSVRKPRLVLAPLLLALSCLGSSTAQKVTVFAASSLIECFQVIAESFQAQNPGTKVTLNFAGSSTLGLQISEGAPADVFASADLIQMQRMAEGGLLGGDSVVFATNRLVVIAPRGSALRGFTDLAEDGVALVLAGPEVPVGRYSRVAVASYDAAAGGGFAAAVLANVVSEESNVRLVATKVALGEADAGIVYATDAAAFPGLVVLAVPAAHSPVVNYAAAVLREASQPDLARAFVDLLLSSEGRTILEAHGFGTTHR